MAAAAAAAVLLFHVHQQLQLQNCSATALGVFATPAPDYRQPSSGHMVFVNCMASTLAFIYSSCHSSSL
jgi:hypothetical protein